MIIIMSCRGSLTLYVSGEGGVSRYISATADRQSRDCAVIPISRDLKNHRIKERDSRHQDLLLPGMPMELLKGIDGPDGTSPPHLSAGVELHSRNPN